MKLPHLLIPLPKLNIYLFFAAQQRIKPKLIVVFMQLTLSQKIYGLCLLLLMFNGAGEYPIISLLIMSALTLEFWPRFTQLWHSLAGKAVLLFCYAVVANFALVNASGLINEITGVSAIHLTYSHNFAILLMLPLWILGFTLAILLLMQFIIPLYLIFLLLLKPFGIKATQLISSVRYPFTTGIVRMGLSMLLLSQLIIYFPDDFQKVARVFDDERVINEVIEEVIDEVDIHQSKTLPRHYEKFIGWSLREFIYQLEADSFSRCQIPEKSRVIELNDYEVLAISKQEKQYTYQVIKCVSPAIGQ